ncbi:unnamed protein product [Meganyctiphanes norvegica]|uniref:Uncharacterized protein n=1 Tax=Meganyctiphanes norvegica TaxID=48144 RepID=A0AAV2QGS9_MEGNR
MAALTLETITTLLQGTQRCPFKMKVIRSNNYNCLRRLIKRSMSIPELASTYKLTCNHWLTDFRELASRAWENLPESELLKLVLEVNHAGTSTLYELLNSATELIWGGDIHGETHDNDGISLSAILQHAPVEGWLAYSVPQLLCLLHSDGEGLVESCDAALTHQYCYVIAMVLNHSPRALKYCTTNFAEELRYYAHESIVKSRLGEACPITPHTLKHAKTIANMIRIKDKNLLR